MEINFFWIGDRFSKMCQLSLKSFLDNDHKVILWVYDDVKNVPDGVCIKNANEILDSSKIFTYKGNGDCRNGSYGGFSDIFRYHLIQKVGGWYCDTDVVCLKNFTQIPDQEYVIRPHSSTKCVANIFKAPKNNNFLKRCIERTENEIDDFNFNWINPLIILNECVEEFSYQKYIVSKNLFGNDNLTDLIQMLDIPFKNKLKFPEYAIHWCNELVTTGQWYSELKRDWEKPIPTSLYYRLLKRHKLL
jgi:hypothetical protein